ncbi:6-phosphogluconolactonase [Fistulifera solaris]|uniref:6-phosphogluconolactonase n=1 Tax=Fistulifera solaris TaxID=1519565 RepID=A0A1Z5JB21_FISSO|nr:6-phosphogluconolactonase [Fistulifera solaris]|eukprot:GAX11018.1 6-phosphogluconolactonase [Fistulifera solaris]
MRWLLLAGVCFSITQGFLRNSPSTRHSSSAHHLLPAKDVWILPTEQDVSKAVHSILENAANKAIAEKGSFALAIPGGSVLTVLSSLEPKGDWVSKTTLAYVNHKCVPNEDLSSAIHAKARNKFLDRWGLTNVVTLDGTADAQAEAMAYQAKLEAIPATVLPRDADGFPLFDLCLIGVGDDGHIGSLYPGRDEINEASKWAIGVEMKSPPSISLTLPVMQRAKQSVVSAAGKSDKYPKGKASAMRMAVDDEQVTPAEFPACALRGTTVWIFDEPNGSEMPSRPRATLDEFLAH